MDSPGIRLNSWKEIAAHLRHDVRTVRRWERERGMPVHRIPGGRGATVFAYVDELDAWMLAGKDHDDDRAQRASASTELDPKRERAGLDVAMRGDVVPPPASRSRTTSRLLFLISLLFLVVFLGSLLFYFSFYLRSASPPVHRLSVLNGAIRALDSTGAVLWEYRGVTAHDPGSFRTSYIGPADASGDQLLVISVDIDDPHREFEASLLAFHRDGRLRWRVAPSDRFRFVSGEYGPSWSCANNEIVSYNVDGETRFAWAMHHSTWWPSLVYFVDSAGKVHGRFVNSGWIVRLSASNDGRYVFASGVSNSLASRVTAVIDARSPSGASPEDESSPYRCLDCPSGRPLHYMAFGDSEVRRQTGIFLLYPVARVVDSRIEVRVPEGTTSPMPETIYEFSLDFNLLRAGRSDGYRERLRDMQENRAAVTPVGRGFSLASPADDIPPVRIWDPTHGWQSQTPSYPAIR